MRINVYSQELLLEDESKPGHIVIESGSQESNTDIQYSFVRMFLHSSYHLHHPPKDDDRSAITFWLPRSAKRREQLATLFEELASMVRKARPETGLD